MCYEFLVEKMDISGKDCGVGLGLEMFTRTRIEYKIMMDKFAPAVKRHLWTVLRTIWTFGLKLKKKEN